MTVSRSVLAPWAVGLAWGLVTALPMVVAARRRPARHRVATLAISGLRARAESASVDHGFWRSAAPIPARLGARVEASVPARVAADVVARRRARRETEVLARELPVALDLVAVAVGAGCTPFLAVEVAARWGPPAIATRLAAVPRACAMGVGFANALADLARAAPTLGPLTDELIAADRLGTPVAPTLARVAATARAEVRRRAETRARTVPVRLLFPLVFLVLPAFGLLTVVPALVAALPR